MRSKNRLTGRRAIVHADIGGNRMLKLLEHWPLMPRRVVIRSQQQHGQMIDGRERCAGDHVGRARPNRRSAGKRRCASHGLGIARRGVDHRLFVARLKVGEILAVFVQRLAESGNITVATPHKCPNITAGNPIWRCLPSRSLNCTERYFTRACAMVSVIFFESLARAIFSPPADN